MKRRFATVALALLLWTAGASAHEPWRVLPNCRLVPNDSNDGDSFHVRAAGHEYIFRLYFADTPETDTSVPERVEEQAKYFALTTAQTIQLGEIAERFTQQKLARPFTIRTCMQDALGRSQQQRFYAFVGTADGDLAELLIANGLARVHGSGAAPVGLSSPQLEWQKLQRLEREAKAQKVGGWGATSGRMTARLAIPPPKSGPDSFDAFFHPERLAKAAQPAEVLPTPGSAWPFPAVPSLARPPAVSAGKLDINAATPAELQNISGIGPVLSQRIIEARPFTSADDLRKVKGIGAKTYEKIRPSFQ